MRTINVVFSIEVPEFATAQEIREMVRFHLKDATQGTIPYQNRLFDFEFEAIPGSVTIDTLKTVRNGA